MFHWFKKHNMKGEEIPDPTPIEVPLRDRPLSLAEQIIRLTKNDELMRRSREIGLDTFDEADDFDIPESEDMDFRTPYEENFYGKDTLPFVQTRMDEIRSGNVQQMPEDRYIKAISSLVKEPTAKPAAVADPKVEAK